jgi:hypothetical protein
MNKPRLFPLVFLLVISCSSPTSDKKPETGDVLATVSIGPAGGVIKAEQVTVTIPNGAFAVQSTVSISTDDSSRFGTSAASASYLLEGIPTNFGAPITVSIESSKSLTGDVYITIGTEGPGLFGVDTVISDRLFPATVTGATATCTIPPGLATAAKKAGASDKDYLAMTATILNDYLNKPAAEHFTVVGPKEKETELIGLAAYCEDIRTRLEGYGFSFYLTGNKYSLSRVKIKGELLKPNVSIFPNIAEDTGPTLVVNLHFLAFPLTDAMKEEAAIRMTNLLAQYYCSAEPGGSFFWFDTAVSYWLGGTMTSTKQNLEPLLVLKGIPDISEINLMNLLNYSSYWMLLIEYLNNRYGLLGNNHLLATMYQERYGGKTIAESIDAVLGTDETTWWPEFVKEYINGNVYGIPATTFLAADARKGSFHLTATDTTKTFSGVFSDLAADIYRITLDPGFASKAGKIRFTAESRDMRDEYLNVLVFGVKGGKPVCIGRGLDFTVTDLSSATDSNTFLAVVANSLLDFPFGFDNDYSLTVTAGTEQDTGLASLSRCTVAFTYFYHEDKVIHPDGTETWAGGGGGPKGWVQVPMTRSGNVFTGQKVDNWSGMWGNSKDVSDITITIAPDLKSARLDLKKVTEQYDYHQLITETYAAWDLPVLDPAEYGMKMVWGTPIADWTAQKHMENFTFTLYEKFTDGSSADVKVQNTYFCTGVVLQFQ